MVSSAERTPNARQNEKTPLGFSGFFKYSVQKIQNFLGREWSRPPTGQPFIQKPLRLDILNGQDLAANNFLPVNDLNLIRRENSTDGIPASSASFGNHPAIEDSVSPKVNREGVKMSLATSSPTFRIPPGAAFADGRISAEGLGPVYIQPARVSVSNNSFPLHFV